MFQIIIVGVLTSLQAFAQLYTEKFIIAPGMQPSVHSSTILEYARDHFLSCWYGGSREGGKDVQIYCSRLTPQNPQWSKPRVAVARQERAENAPFKNKTIGNPVLFKGVGDDIWMVYASRPFGGWTLSNTDYKLSTDQGRTWSASRRLISHFGHLPRIKPLQLDAEHLLFPFYVELPKWGYSAVLKIAPGSLTMVSEQPMRGFNHFQPSFVELNGQIFAYSRNKKIKNVSVARLDMSTMTWSAQIALPDLPNPNSSIDTVSRDGKQVLIVYNHHAYTRSPLTLAISSDAKNFKRLADLEVFKDGAEYSYPSFIRSESGEYHVTFTHLRRGIKHISFDEAWLQSKF